MSRDAKAADLLYVTNSGAADVKVYSYPKDKLTGTLTGFVYPAGACVDKSGDVFIADEAGSKIYAYAHGGTSPIRTLDDPGFAPADCAVNPSNGYLAVTNVARSGSKPGNVAIYKDAKGAPKAYYGDPDLPIMVFCGYDGSGNLFVDGETSESSSGTFAFAELPKGKSAFVNVKLDQPIGIAGGVLWDGKYVAVLDSASSTIYRFDVKGKKGTEEGETPLLGATTLGQFWLDGKKVVGPDFALNDTGIWDYPSGGSVKKKITGLDAPVGATISPAKKHA